MILEGFGKKIANNQRNSYLIGMVIGLFIFTLILYFSDWNPTALVTSALFVELSVFTGVLMRFLSGLGITLTYTAFSAAIFKMSSSVLKGNRARLKALKGLVLIPALVIVGYSAYTTLGVILFARSPSYFDLLSMIFGVWSLMIMVYGIPILRDEYKPVLQQTSREMIGQKIGDWRFSLWRGYQSRIHRDYGRIATGEFERYGAQLFVIRAVLSGLLLLPISLILVMITPLAIVSTILWVRLFSLNHSYFSKLERALLIIVTCTVAVLSTISFKIHFSWLR